MSIDALIPSGRDKYLAAIKVPSPQRDLNQKRCIAYCEAILQGYPIDLAIQVRDKVNSTYKPKPTTVAGAKE